MSLLKVVFTSNIVLYEMYVLNIIAQRNASSLTFLAHSHNGFLHVIM